MIGVMALRPGTLRRRRSFRLGAAVGAILPLGLLLAFSLVSERDSSSDLSAASPEVAAHQRALESFEEALRPVVDAGAATVVYGMRPGINDIYDGRFDDETLLVMAEGWVASMTAARDDFVALDVPEFLTEVAELHRRAFDEYVATATALLDAAGATGDARSDHITRAAEHGTQADRLYDAAEAELEGFRERLMSLGSEQP